MDLLERYLQAVGQYLPTKSRQDTLAELRANLLEQMDARAEELERELTDADVADILRAHGRPELVAGRYLPQRSLIGPTLFPVYTLTLRKAAPFVVFVYAIIRCITVLAASAGMPLAKTVVQAFLHLIPTLLIFWASVTIVFAAIEFARSECGAAKEWTDNSSWDPSKLPPVKKGEREGKQKSLASRIAELIVHILWMLYVFAVPAHHFLVLGPGVYFLETLGVGFAPIWHVFFVFLIVLLVVQLFIKLLAVASASHPLLKLLELASHLIGVAMAGMMAFTTSQYFVAASAAANLQHLADVNRGMGIAFRIALFFATIGLLTESWESMKKYIPGQKLAF